MSRFRRIAIGEDCPDAVTVGIERDAEGRIMASVWWPARGEADAGEASYPTVEAALEAAEAARVLHGFSQVVVTLQSEDLWHPEWGSLEPQGMQLSEAESYELARATEASRDA